MSDIATVGWKALNGGVFVVGFALVSELLRPKRFAGLFSAAPSVALANLMVVVWSKGHSDAVASARGMVAGGVAFAVSAISGVHLVRRYGALRASAGIVLAWFLAALACYVTFLT